MAEEKQAGVREVVLVAVAVVAVVLGAAVLTSLLPEPIQRLVFHAPLAIGVLVTVTVIVLWRVAVGRRPAP